MKVFWVPMRSLPITLDEFEEDVVTVRKYFGFIFLSSRRRPKSSSQFTPSSNSLVMRLTPVADASPS